LVGTNRLGQYRCGALRAERRGVARSRWPRPRPIGAREGEAAHTERSSRMIGRAIPAWRHD